jgi:hypothetical protein
VTAEKLLAAALHGRDDWDKVYEACQDREQAQLLASMLETSAPAGSEEAVAWARLLEEMHPGIAVKLTGRTAP